MYLRPSSPVCPVRALTAGIASYTDLQAVAKSRGLTSPSSPVCPVRAGIIVFAPVAPVVQFVWLGRWLTMIYIYLPVCCLRPSSPVCPVRALTAGNLSLHIQTCRHP